MEQKFSNNSLDLETLQEVHTDGEDYFLKIDSPAKALKEESMNRKFRKGFEDGLQAIAASIDKKGGTRKRDAVLKRIGKLEGKYPSIVRYYQIDVPDDGKGKVTEVRWQLHLPERQVFGTYFLRTNVKKLNGITAGDPYATDPVGGFVRTFVLNFFDNESAGITTANITNDTNADGAWYTLDGRKLDGKPTAKGMYINNGCKVVIK